MSAARKPVKPKNQYTGSLRLVVDPQGIVAIAPKGAK